MKKRFFGILLMGAMVVASMSMFTSCKDYDDDIARLQEAIDQNSKTIGEIQKLIANGGVVTGVTSIENGVRVTMSGNLGSFDILNGKDGQNGRDGVDGKNGAQGEKGADGQPGLNGKDGKDGTVWTIGADGFWYLNGEPTTYLAVATAAPSTTTTIIEASPKYYIPNPATGCFDIYQDGVKVESTMISFIGTGSITATMDQDVLTLYGIAGALGPNNSIAISLTGVLKSLVFMPKLYLDGIESVEYPWVGDTTLRFVARATAWPNLSHHGTASFDLQDITGETNDYQPNTLGRYYDKATNTIKKGLQRPLNYQLGTTGKDPLKNEIWVYGPVWPIDYHLNPQNAKVAWDDNKPSFSVLEPEVIYYNTRASESALGISSPKTYEWYNNENSEYYTNKDVFARNDKGILTVGLQIQNPNKLAPWPTDNTINPNGNTDSQISYPAPGTAAAATANGVTNDSDPGDNYNWYNEAGDEVEESWYGKARYEYNKNNTDNTIALQMHQTDGADTDITSDYALIVPSRITLEGLIWDKKPMYKEPNMPGYAYGPANRDGDEEGWALSESVDCMGKRIHIWDTPEEALRDPDGAALELGALDAKGLDLRPYIGLHVLKENIKKKELAPRVYNPWVYDVVTLHYGEEKQYGMHYEFELVEYISSTNTTSDSRYATFSDWTATESHNYNNATYTIVKDWNAPYSASDKRIKNTSITGIIQARNVTPDGKTVTEQSTSSVDREPLVRVLLKRNSDGLVLLDGYILLHIDHTPDNLEVDNYPAKKATWNLCDPLDYETTWAQFSRYILTDKMSGVIASQETGAQKQAFDDWYWADCVTDPSNAYVLNTDDKNYVTDNVAGGQTGQPYYYGIDDAHGRGYQLKIFNFGSDIYGNDGVAIKTGSADPETTNAFEQKALGTMVYYPNGEGTTNHTFRWILSEEELEYLTHHMDELKKTKPEYIVTEDGVDYVLVTRWFRYIAKDYDRLRDVNKLSAPYPYVWVKMQMRVARNTKGDTYNEKNTNYWYNWNELGNLNETQVIDGWSAVALDIKAPENAQTIKDKYWNSPIHNTTVGNMAKLVTYKNGKYYFTPKTNFEITALNGKKYRITVENKNYKQPFKIRDHSHEGIVDDKCYVSNVGKTFGDGTRTNGANDPRDFVNSTPTWKTYDQLFCKYVWPHSYVNLNEPKATSAQVPFLPDPANIKGTALTATWNFDGIANRTYELAVDKHDWSEATLEGTLKWCSIIYEDQLYGNKWRNAGVFNDTILYAENITPGDPDKGLYTPIARITKQEFVSGVKDIEAGNLQLIHYLPIDAVAADVKAGTAVENYACYDVLNALGYPTKNANGYDDCDFEYAHRYLNQQLRAWVGVVAVNDCNVARYVEQGKYDDNNVATFLASWERPINLKTFDPDYALDARTNENYVYFIDYLKMYDWRGDKPNSGYMYDDHFWFWAYYNIKEIDVDMRTDQIRTNMHHPELTVDKTQGRDAMVKNIQTNWPKLSEITTQARLYNIRVINPNTATAEVRPGSATLGVYQFDLCDAADRFTYAVNNNALKAFMGISPVSNVNKARFGGFYYANNGDNVTEFDVLIPVTIHYEWGKYKTYLLWHIDTTHGRSY
jgi:hypothetical protein